MKAYQELFQLRKLRCSAFKQRHTSEFYHILLMKGEGMISVDFMEYSFRGRIALFTSPYQHTSLTGTTDFELKQLSFHGDFYCIEYHKNEVACNGLLFNNIYKQPFIYLPDDELDYVFDKLSIEAGKQEAHSEPILRTYLQLMLAISSKIKKLDSQVNTNLTSHSLERFRQLLEQHFMQHRDIAFYAGQMIISTSTFARKIKAHFGKSPSQLIQERVMLEAKKQLHLTHKSIKEVAAALHFDDEHYFSRFFKKQAGVSPTTFREKVGISIVADLSMQ